MAFEPSFPVGPEPLEWRRSLSPVPYPEAVRFMEERAAAIREGTAPECVWLLEHPALYTAGTSADPRDLLDSRRFPVFQSGRGGQFTYHGPGQRVAYVMLDLDRHGRDIRAFVHSLEDWLIRTLAAHGILGERREDRVGIWIDRGNGREDKIAAIGIRVRRWVTFHGVSINVRPDLTHFSGIVPCGIAKHGVTSMEALGCDIRASDIDKSLRENFFLPLSAKGVT